MQYSRASAPLRGIDLLCKKQAELLEDSFPDE